MKNSYCSSALPRTSEGACHPGSQQRPEPRRLRGWALLLLRGAVFHACGAAFVACAAAAQSPVTVPLQVTVPIRDVAGYRIIPVLINGTGPYDFVLDTGSNRTLVQQRLLDRLRVRCTDAALVHMATGESRLRQATVGSIAIGALRIDHFQVGTLQAERPGLLKTPVDGVLGEDYLKHFDMLLDNQNLRLSLDATSGLARGLTGERLHLAQAGRFGSEATPDRLIVEVRMPSVHPRALQFLLDTGTNTALFFPAGGKAGLEMDKPGRVQMYSYAGSIACRLRTANLELGNSTVEGMEISLCDGLTREKMDTDGLLPTALFRQVFISHKGAYAIANPRSVRAVNEAGVTIAMNR